MQTPCAWKSIVGAKTWEDTQKTWTAPTVDPVNGLLYNTCAGGHGVKDPGSAGLDLNRLLHFTMRCPTPDTVSGTHHYGTQVRDPDTGLIYHLRPFRRFDPQTKTFESLGQITFNMSNGTEKVGGVYWDSVAFWDRHAGKPYGTIRAQYENNAWRELDVETGVSDLLPGGSIPSNGITHACELDEDRTLWRHGDSADGDFSSIWNTSTRSWEVKWRRVTGDKTDWKTGIKYDSDHGLTPIVYAPDLGWCWTQPFKGPDAWVEKWFNPDTGEQRRAAIPGAPLPRVLHTLGRSAYWRYADDLAVLVWYYGEREMIRFMVLGDMDESLFADDAPVEPPVDPPVEPEPPVVEPPVEPEPPVDHSQA